MQIKPPSANMMIKLVLLAFLAVASAFPQGSPTTDAPAAVAPATTPKADEETTVAVAAADAPAADLSATTLRIVTTQHEGPMRGFLDDLTELLQADLGFNSTSETVHSYGIKNQEGKWNGMIAKLLDGEADVAVSDLTITDFRKEAIDFTTPFVETGVIILIKKSDVGNMSSVNCLAHSDRVNATAVGSGSTRHFLQESQSPPLKTIYAKMTATEKEDASKIPKSNAEAIAQVKAGGVAAIMEHLSARQVINNDCDLTLLGDKLNTIEWGLGLPKGSPHTAVLSQAIQKLKDSGKIDDLKAKHWLKPINCPSE